MFLRIVFAIVGLLVILAVATILGDMLAARVDTLEGHDLDAAEDA